MEENKNQVFSGKTFSELLKDIYLNSEKKKKQIDILIHELKPLVQTTNEAAVIVPLIKEYLEIGVKNDEQLIKMASVYQKFAASELRASTMPNGQNMGMLTPDEKEQLLKEVANELIKAEDLENSDESIENDLDVLLEKTKSVLKESESDTGEK